MDEQWGYLVRIKFQSPNVKRCFKSMTTNAQIRLRIYYCIKSADFFQNQTLTIRNYEEFSYYLLFIFF